MSMLKTYLTIILYLTEYHLIRLIAHLRGWPLAPLPKLTQDQKVTLDFAFKGLLGRWKVLIRSRPRLTQTNGPRWHVENFRLVLEDLREFLTRKDRRESHDIAKALYASDCPDYFKRNYHYQTDGYFTFDSARRYDHQIELLFLGTGHIMRKVAYATLVDVLPANAEVLEYGAGGGTSGAQFKLLFPDAKLDLLEPGAAYLDHAKAHYPSAFNRLMPEFMERFKAESVYDCVFSCFVMYEIPVAHWEDIAKAIKDALKPGGHLLLIDAQQDNDRPEVQFAIDQFAEDFYEPYFAEYRKTPLETFMTENGFELLKKEEVLFSKALLFRLKR